jgi:hypothetical protein
MLDRARLRRRPPRLFLGLRDVLDDPAVIRRVWSDLGAYEYLRSYDAVLVYGSSDIYDAASAYGLLPGARSVIYSGYVSPPPSPVVSRPRRDREFLLMMGGGGRDAFPLASAFVDALPTVFRDLGTPGVLLTGPSMSGADREALVARAPPCVRIERGFGPATDWVRRASAVLTMGGYNSLAEVLKWRKKALVVPRAGPSAEQRIRTRLFSERSLIRVLGPGPLVPEELAEALTRLIVEDGVPDTANIPPLNGAQGSATVLLVGRPHAGLGAGALNDRIRPAPPVQAEARARESVPVDAPRKRRAPGRSRSTTTPRHNGRSLPRAALDLPLLEALLDPDAMGPRLGELLSPGARNGWAPRLRSVELVTYKPGRRALVAYDVELPSKGKRMRVLGKHFSDRAQARRVWKAKLALHSGRPRRSFVVPQPLDWIPELSLVLYNPAVGRPFAVRARDTGRFVRLAARSLAELHASGVSLDRRLELTKELVTLAGWAQFVNAAHPDHGSAALEVLEGLRKLEPEIGLELDVPIHKDFHHEHLVLGPRLAVLDLDEMRYGDPSFDLAHFCTYLKLLVRRAGSSPGLAEALEQVFLEEYARLTGWTRDERFTYFCAYTALKIAKQLCAVEGVAPRPTGAEQRRQVRTMLKHARALVTAVV